MENIILYSIAFAGIVMLFDYAMWEGNIMSWYYDWLDKSKYRIVNVFGICKICVCFWWGIVFYYFIFHSFDKTYLIFLGISEMIIIFYHILILFLKK